MLNNCEVPKCTYQDASKKRDVQARHLQCGVFSSTALIPIRRNTRLEPLTSPGQQDDGYEVVLIKLINCLIKQTKGRDEVVRILCEYFYPLYSSRRRSRDFTLILRFPDHDLWCFLILSMSPCQKVGHGVNYLQILASDYCISTRFEMIPVGG